MSIVDYLAREFLITVSYKYGTYKVIKNKVQVEDLSRKAFSISQNKKATIELP